MTIIGSAEVVIRAITTGIAADIKKGLNDARPAIAAEGEEAGRAYSEGFGSKANKDRVRKGVEDSVLGAMTGMSQAGDDHGAAYSGGFARTVKTQLPAAIGSAIGAATPTGQANAAGGRTGDAYAKGIADRISKALKSGLRDPFSSPFFRASEAGTRDGSAYNRGFLSGFDRNKIEGVFSKLSNTVGKFMSGGMDAGIIAARNAMNGLIATTSILGPAISVLIASLGSLAGGLFVVAGAAVQAAGALAAIPVGLLAFAQGAIVATQASKGVMSAIKSAVAAKESSVRTDKQVADTSAQVAAKAQAIADAQKQLGRVQEDNASRIADATDKIKDAQENMGDIQEANAQKVADANKDVLNSEKDLVQSKQDVAQAQLDLNDAYKEGAESLQQLNFDAEGAALAEEEAGIRLQKARENMLKTRADSGASALDRQQADLDFKQADLNYRQSKDRAQDLAKTQEAANKKGVAGTQEVVDAKKNVLDAQDKENKAVQAVADAQENEAKVRQDNQKAVLDGLKKIADAEDNLQDVRKQNARALADAQEALQKANAIRIQGAQATAAQSTALTKAQEAYNKLGKNQKAFVDQVLASRDTWLSFRNSLGERLFAGLGADWKTFTDSIAGTKDHITPVGKALQGTAGIVQQFAHQFLTMFKEGSEGGKLLGTFLEGNNKLLETFTKKGKNGMSAFQSLGLVIMRVLVAAQPMVQRFATWAAGLATNWETATRQGSSGSKKLTTFFKNAGDAVFAWGQIFHDFGVGIKNIFEDSKDARTTFMTDLQNLATRFKTWTDDAKNNKGVSEWFKGAYANFKSILGVIGEIALALLHVGDNPAIKQSFDALGANLHTSLEKIISPFINAGPQVVGLFNSVKDIIITMTSGNGLQTFLKILTGAFEGINKFLSLGPVKAVMGWLAPIAAALAAIRLTQTIVRQVTKPLASGLIGARNLAERINRIKTDGWGSLFTGKKSITANVNFVPLEPISALIPKLTPVPIEYVPINSAVPGAGVGGGVGGGGGGGTPKGKPPVVVPKTPVTKVTTSVATGVGAAASAEAGVVANAATKVGSATKVLTTFGKVAGAVGRSIPFVGTAIALASVAFDLWGGKSNEATAETQAFDDANKDLVSTLDPTTGAITRATIEMAAQKDATDGLLQKVRDLGLNVDTWTDASTGNSEAQKRLTSDIQAQERGILELNPHIGEFSDALIRAGITQDDVIKDFQNGEQGLNDLGVALQNGGIKGDELIRVSAALGQTYKDTKDQLQPYYELQGEANTRTKFLADAGKDLADKTDLAKKAMGGAAGATNVLKGSVDLVIPSMGGFETITDKVRVANEKFDTVVGQVQTALDILRGRTPGYSEAMSAYGEALSTMNTAFTTGAKGATEFDDAAVDATGGINFMSEDGRKLNDTLTDMQNKTAAAAKAAFDQAGGLKNLKVATAASDKIIAQGNAGMAAFIGTLGLGPAKVKGLTDSLGTVPKNTTTAITIATRQANEDLTKFMYDNEGKIIGVKAQADTKVAEKDIDNWVWSEDHKTPLYRKVGADTKLGEGQIAEFVYNEEGEVIALQATANPDDATTKLKTFRDAQTQKPLTIALDADKTAALGKMTDLQKDAKGNPLVWNTVIGKDAQGNDVVDAYVEKKDGTKIDLGIVTSVTTTAAPPDLGKLKKAGNGNKFIMQPVATGGYISGPGGPTDDMIPAWLSNGEFVIRAAMVRRYGRQLLEKFNRGALKSGGGSGIPGFKDGGLATPPSPRKTAEYLSNVMSLSNTTSHNTDTFTVKSVGVPRNKDIDADWIALSQIPWVPKVEVGVDAINVTRNTEWTTFMTALTKFFKDRAAPGNIAYSPTAGVEQWRSLVLQALKMTNQPAAYVTLVLRQMQTESSGNPNAINLTDINARRGTPSKGLLQVIDPTFQAYKYPGYDNIWDPLSNILASIRYVLGRYGSIPAGMRGLPYDTGGILNNRSLGINMSGRPERVLTPAQTTSFDRLVNTITSTTSGTSTQTGGVPNAAGILSSRERQMVSAIASGVAAQQNTMQPTVRVFIGEQELRGIVSSELVAYDKGTARIISLGKKP